MKNIQDEIREAIDENKDQTDFELWARLGYSVGADATFRGSDDSDKAAGTTARGWLAARLKDIRSMVCGKQKVRRWAESADGTTDLGLLLSLAGVLSEKLAPFSATIVAILIARRGIERFCRGEDL